MLVLVYIPTDRTSMPVSVLIVDDEPALNELFVIGLNKYGYTTKGVLGGEECLNLLSDSYIPDLILLDMMMEPMDGWETLIRIKKIEKAKTTPVILQTGKNLTYKEAERFVSYIEDYIMKPITPKRCIGYIEETLAGIKEVNSIIESGLKEGYKEEEVRRYAELLRTINVAKKLLSILESHYGTEKPEPDYMNFLSNLESEFIELKERVKLQ